MQHQTGYLLTFSRATCVSVCAVSRKNNRPARRRAHKLWKQQKRHEQQWTAMTQKQDVWYDVVQPPIVPLPSTAEAAPAVRQGANKHSRAINSAIGGGVVGSEFWVENRRTAEQKEQFIQRQRQSRPASRRHNTMQDLLQTNEQLVQLGAADGFTQQQQQWQTQQWTESTLWPVQVQQQQQQQRFPRAHWHGQQQALQEPLSSSDQLLMDVQALHSSSRSRQTWRGGGNNVATWQMSTDLQSHRGPAQQQQIQAAYRQVASSKHSDQTSNDPAYVGDSYGYRSTSSPEGKSKHSGRTRQQEVAADDYLAGKLADIDTNDWHSDDDW